MGERCPKKIYRKRKGRDEDRFRSSAAWQRKREQVKQRDKYLCRLCLDEGESLNGNSYNYTSLSVHHIEPLCEDWERRLEEDNLITLCPWHHELAESGKVSRERLHILAQSEPLCKNTAAKMKVIDTLDNNIPPPK